MTASVPVRSWIKTWNEQRASAAVLREDGWAATTHAEVARRSGYSKATIYAHWPTPLDLICEDTSYPPSTGEFRTDLHAALTVLAQTLTEGRYDRLMAGVIACAGQDPAARELRDLLYANATTGIRDILAEHLAPG